MSDSPFSILSRCLSERVESLASSLLGDPSHRSSKEWRYGKKRSLVITLQGENRGRFMDFETGERGSSLDLVSYKLGLKGLDLLKWAESWLGEGHDFHHHPSPHHSKDSAVSWTPVFPIPYEALAFDLNSYPLSLMLKGRKETGRYIYKNAKGDLLGYVIRLCDEERNKITPTLTYCENEKGDQMWRWKGFGENRPLFGLYDLALYPNQDVLIVEGEKTALCAKDLFPEMCVITWSGGVHAVTKTDWAPLKGRDVIIWPDYDVPGIEAAHKIQSLITSIVKAVRVVELPALTPSKWDLADPIPLSWGPNRIKEILFSSVRSKW